MVNQPSGTAIPIRIPEVNNEPIAYVYADEVVVCFGHYTPNQWKFINVEVYKALQKLNNPNNLGTYSSGPSTRPVS